MKYYPQYNNFVTWPAMLIPPAVYVVVAVLASRIATSLHECDEQNCDDLKHAPLILPTPRNKAGCT